jgi:hypothetical protein
MLATIRLYESIHVNGDKVHIRICVAPCKIPPKTAEMHWTFGQEFEFINPITSTTMKAVPTKVSDTKWVIKVSTGKFGEITVTYDMVGTDLWMVSSWCSKWATSTY